MRPRRTVTPSCSSSTRWVSMLPTLARRLIPPCAFTTRCQGRWSGTCFIACPTARATKKIVKASQRPWFASGAALVIQPGLTKAVRGFGLTLASGGLVDINDGKLIADYSVNDPIGTLTTKIA